MLLQRYTVVQKQGSQQQHPIATWRRQGIPQLHIWVTFRGLPGTRFDKKTHRTDIAENKYFGAAAKYLLLSYKTFRDRRRCQATTARWSLLEMKTEGGKTKGTTFMTRR